MECKGEIMVKANANVAIIASLVSEPSRAAILTALLDGRFHPASELAYMAGIKPQTASFHLAKLSEADVVSVEKHGRHRYYGIRNQEVAQVMETMLSIAPPPVISSLKQSVEDKAVRYARTCYDHLAGFAGVQVTEGLLARGLLVKGEKEFAVTANGEQFLADLGIDLGRTRAKRRSFSHCCLDWSERRHHLAGALGHALLDKWLDLRWIQRLTGTRAVTVTAAGKQGFKDLFGMDMEREPGLDS